MVLILSGPTCIGKGYAEQIILKYHPDAKKIRYFTTRPTIPRDDNGVSLSARDFSCLVDVGDLVLADKVDGFYYAFMRKDLLRDDGIYIAEMTPKQTKNAKKMIPECFAISFVVDPSETEILRERMRRKEIPESEIVENIKKANLTVRSIRENYLSYDAIVNVSKSYEQSFSETVLSLVQTFITA